MFQRYHYLQFLLSCFDRNQFFSTTFTLQRENFEIWINSLHRELWRRRIFWNTCSISFGLHDIDIDAHDFNNWAKKEEENSTIKFYFCQFMIMKDRSPSYQKYAMELNM